MFSLVLLFAPLAYATGPVPPLPVDIFYESLCPDSIKFFTNQLYTTYTSSLKPRINITLIPFGKASYQANGDDYSFTCHHGPNECYGNKVQACAINYVTDEPKRMALLNCLMGTALADRNGTYPIKSCGESTQVPINDIVTCANTTEGSHLLAKFGDITNQLSPKLTSVPTIIIDNKQQSEEAFTNFRGVLCSILKGDKPTDCSPNSASSLILSTGLMALLVLVQIA